MDLETYKEYCFKVAGVGGKYGGGFNLHVDGEVYIRNALVSVEVLEKLVAIMKDFEYKNEAGGVTPEI
jgi:hypothetical protein